MPRTKLIRSSYHPYHVTIRSNNREWFDVPMPMVWSFCKEALKHAYMNYPVKLQAFVLMSNHYHLLIWTPDANLDKFMYKFNYRLSYLLRQETARINRIFGDRYKWSIIQDEKYYQVVLKYIYQNPLAINLVRRCEDYKFSTLYYLKNKKAFSTPIYCDDDDVDKYFFDWINEKEGEVENYKIMKAISRPRFMIPCAQSLKNASNI